MKVRALKQREIILFIISIIGVMVFLLKTYVVQPFHAWDDRLSAQIRKQAVIESENKFIIDQTKNIQNRFKWIAMKYGKSRSDAQELSGMVNDIEALAKSLDIFIVQMQPRKPQVKEKFVDYIVDLSFQADWVELVTFLDRLESNPLHYKINSIKAEKNPGGVRLLKGTLVILSEKFELDQ